MKLLRFATVLGLVCLAGCTTLPERDRLALDAHHVSAPVYQRMLRREPLSLDEIVELSNRHLPTTFILRYLNSTYFVYRLSSADVNWLQKSKVDRSIIDYMLATPSIYAPVAYSYPYPFYDPIYDGYYGPIYSERNYYFRGAHGRRR